MPDWVGKTLGSVHIKSLVARGGMAEVYLGTHETLGEVAVKVMRGLIERESEHYARFQREASVVTNLKHPNIVQMAGYDVLDETPYLVMEYINGPTLANYLKVLHDKKQTLPIGTIARLLTSLASALDYAHSQGMVHRDVKPANVLLRSASGPVDILKPLPPDVEPVLTDFGLVRIMDSTMHTTTGSVSGTPAYMSPEQARGEKVDKRSDIYSLGVLLYEMLAGEVPFQADTTFGMLMKHINEPPPPIKSISYELQAVIDRTLAKDPALRYSSAGELAKEFVALFNGETISPGTLHIADIARQVAESSAISPRPAINTQPSNRWLRIGLEVIVLIGLGVILFSQITGRSLFAGSPTPTSSISQNSPIGRARYNDYSELLDRIALSLSTLPPPAEGFHYEAWLTVTGAEIRRNIGRITFDTGLGQLVFIDSDAKNLLGLFDQLEITLEPDNDPNPAAPGDVVYSSVFPPQTLVYIRDLLVVHEGTANPLIFGMWNTADYVHYATVGTSAGATDDLQQAFARKDEEAVRRFTEEIINEIAGSQNADLYKDWDNNGTINDPNSNDGYGLLSTKTTTGYIQDVETYAQKAADAPDSTPNIRNQNTQVQVCVQNINDWTKQILENAIKLNKMSFGPEMEPLVIDITNLATKMISGTDTNGNGLVEPIAGECGADKAYEYAYYMADMPILPGKNRIPATGK